MAQAAPRYRLRLSRLDFVSLVDEPAQPNAKTLLIKRKGAAVEGETEAKFVKASDELGLAFFWAFTSTNPDGSDHFDHHSDTIDQDFLKAAMDFMKNGGGSVDEMHDGSPTDARVVFAMPMTPEIAKAFSFETKQSGLMVALKVTDDQLAKLKDGTYTGVSIAGLGVREPVAARKSADKRYFTDEVMGHQHEVSVYDDGYPWMTDATVEGGAASHRHTVTRDAEGALLVLADAGHTHTLTEMPRVIVAPADAVVLTEEKSRTRAAESSRPANAANVNPLKKESAMDTAKIIADLEAALAALKLELEASKADLKTESELTDEEKAHAAKLDTAEAKRFRALSKSERVAAVAKALESDPVIVTVAGKPYRKSTPGVELAEIVAKQQAELDAADVAKQATAHLGNFTGEADVHAFIVKSILATKNADMIAKALATLDGANAIIKGRAVAPGTDGNPSNVDGSADDNAYAALTKGLHAFCKANSIEKPWTVGLEKFKATPEGAALKRAYDAALTAG